MADSIFHTFFNRVVNQSIENGNNYVRPIIHVGNSKTVRGVPEYIGLAGEHPAIPTNKPLPKSLEKKLTNIIMNNELWDLHVNNPRLPLSPELDKVKLVPSIEIGEQSYSYFPSLSTTPTITINNTLAPFVKDSYTIAADGSNLSEIPLFFIVRKPLEHSIIGSWPPILGYATETSHLSVIVVCNKILYSFGFGQLADPEQSPGKPEKPKRAELRENVAPTGLMGSIMKSLPAKYIKNPFTVFKGVFNTPDANPFLLTKTGERRNYEIIDVGVFTKKHTKTILDKLAFKPSIGLHPTGSPIQSWYLDIEYKADKYNKSYIYPTISIIVPELEYKLCSKVSNTTFNCTTFIESIFPEHIQCIGMTTAYSKPTRCVRKIGNLKADNLHILSDILSPGTPTKSIKSKEQHIQSIFEANISDRSVNQLTPVPAEQRTGSTLRGSRKSPTRGVVQTSGTGSETRRRSHSKRGKSTRRSRA